ncbi:hypothetical protein H9L12_05970 [Sphingomonas rhizophila]|uniref:Uncharacterized protein n=1 Tax=Sphingomonas rhizophila TaxID=2071607 RepID=A0A7G9SDW5_9SPHN|nr:hypothetical protein [Sphingomonas rhizophila]QNN66040.1 hypothetical protein H9L12_05970 [Sphingomonas rhizophila]
MSTSSLDAALDRTERALLRIERSLSGRREGSGRDEVLRSKVAAIVGELDDIIRQAGVHG